MSDGIKKFKLTKRYGRSIKNHNSDVVSFGTELETEIEADSGDKLIAAANLLFSQAKALTEKDIAKEFGKE